MKICPRTKDVIVGMLVFGLLGPAFGALLISILFVGIDLVDPANRVGDGWQDELGALPGFYVLVLALGYYSQGIAAMLTGGIAGWWRKRLHSWRWRWAVGVCGGLMVFLKFVYSGQDDASGLWFSCFMACVGFLASLVCCHAVKYRSPADV